MKDSNFANASELEILTNEERKKSRKIFKQCFTYSLQYYIFRGKIRFTGIVNNIKRSSNLACEKVFLRHANSYKIYELKQFLTFKFRNCKLHA